MRGEIDLKPCPFCGGTASLGVGYRGGSSGDKKYHFVNCTDCMVSNVMIADMQVWDEADAVEAWNRRARESVQAAAKRE